MPDESTPAKPTTYLESLQEPNAGHLRTILLATTRAGRIYIRCSLLVLIKGSMLVALPVILICASIQTYILGWKLALQYYWPYWVAGLGFVFFCIVFAYSFLLLVVVGPELLGGYLAWKYPARFGWLRYIKVFIANYLGPIIGLSFMLLLIIGVAYSSSKETRVKLGLDQKTDLPSVTQVATQQTKTLDALTASGKTMLTDLDNTETEIDSAKVKLTDTLNGLAQQEKDAQAASQELKDLAVKEQILRDRMQAARQAVNGEQIPTLEDIQNSLEASSRKDQAWNFLWAIPAGIISIVFWELVIKRIYTYISLKKTPPPPSLTPDEASSTTAEEGPNLTKDEKHD